MSAGISSIALGSIAYSLVVISESAKNFNAVLKRCYGGKNKMDGSSMDSIESGCLCNGEIFEEEVNNLDA